MVATGQLSKPLLETLPTVFHLQLVRHTSPVFSALAQLICIPQNSDELQRHRCLCGARFPGWTLGVCHAREAALFLHPLCCAFCSWAFPLALSCHPSTSTCFNTCLMHSYPLCWAFFLLALHKMMASERWLAGVQLFQGVPLKAEKVGWKISWLNFHCLGTFHFRESQATDTTMSLQFFKHFLFVPVCFLSG